MRARPPTPHRFRPLANALEARAGVSSLIIGLPALSGGFELRSHREGASATGAGDVSKVLRPTVAPPRQPALAKIPRNTSLSRTATGAADPRSTFTISVWTPADQTDRTLVHAGDLITLSIPSVPRDTTIPAVAIPSAGASSPAPSRSVGGADTTVSGSRAVAARTADRGDSSSAPRDDGVIRPLTLAPSAPVKGGTPLASAMTFSGGGDESGGSGGSGSGGGVDHTGWHVTISGGSSYSMTPTLPTRNGGFKKGHQRWDQDPIPDIPQGSFFTGYPLLSSPGASGYELTSYTWTFPQGAVKGYGEFAELEELAGGQTHDYFYNYPTRDLAQDPTRFPFTADDLSWDGPDTFDDVLDEFYWGPDAVGPSKVEVVATYEKTVNGQVDTFTDYDYSWFFVHRFEGTIQPMEFGNPGVGKVQKEITEGITETQYWLSMDRDSALDSPVRPVGIHYWASITNAPFGSFTVIQTQGFREVRKWTDANGVNHQEENGFYLDDSNQKINVDANGKPVQPPNGSPMRMVDFAALDSISEHSHTGIGYGFRLNDPTMGGLPEMYIFYGAASVKDADLNTNKLYGNDSPRTKLPPNPAANYYQWARTDFFKLTLMYKPEPNPNAAYTETWPAPSIWVPVGKLEWSWRASAAYVPGTGGSDGKWVDTYSPFKFLGLYSETKKFPEWWGYRNGPQKPKFETFFPMPYNPFDP